MPRLTTQTKIRIARVLSRSAIALRRLQGRESSGVFSRGGLRWNLDLTEGIDLSIYLFGRFEREVAKAYGQLIKPGATVLDIGANIGAHALPMALLCGKGGTVHAFEPTVYAIDKLTGNLALNPQLKDRLCIHHALLNEGYRAAATPDAIPSSWQLRDERSDRKHPQHGGSYKTLGEAACMTLDHFVKANELERIHLIKLDVDGNEWSVLQGGTATIRRLAPPILMEFALDYDHDAFENMLGFLQEAQYTATRLTDGRPLPLGLKQLRAYIPKNGSINVLLRSQLTSP